MIGVGVGTGVLVFLWGFNDGAHAAMRRNLQATIVDSLQVHAKGWFAHPRLHHWIAEPEKVLGRIRKLAPNAPIALRVHSFALAAGAKEASLGAVMLGVQPKQEARLSRLDEKVGRGRWLSSPTAYEAVIGEGTARALGLKLGDDLALLVEDRFGTLAAERFVVVGIITSGERGIDRGLIIVPIDAARALLSLDRQAHEIVVLLPDEASIRRIDQALEAQLTGDLEVLRWDEMYPVMQQWIDIDNAFMRLFLFIVLVIAAASVGNAALMSAIERRHEFALLAALGARPRLIGAMVLAEGVLLAGFGGVLGAGLGGMTIAWFGVHGIDLGDEVATFARFYFEPIVYPEIESRHFWETLLVMWVACTLAAWWPARSAARTHPAQVLRG